jgi:hypothetical protein
MTPEMARPFSEVEAGRLDNIQRAFMRGNLIARTDVAWLLTANRAMLTEEQSNSQILEDFGMKADDGDGYISVGARIFSLGIRCEAAESALADARARIAELEAQRADLQQDVTVLEAKRDRAEKRADAAEARGGAAGERGTK